MKPSTFDCVVSAAWLRGYTRVSRGQARLSRIVLATAASERRRSVATRRIQFPLCRLPTTGLALLRTMTPGEATFKMRFINVVKTLSMHLNFFWDARQRTRTKPLRISVKLIE